MEKKNRAYVEKVKRFIKKDKAFRMTYVTETIGTDLQDIEARGNKEEKWCAASTPETLEEQFISHIRDMLQHRKFPKTPTENELQELFEEMKNDGILEIVPKYTFSIDQKKLNQKVESCRKHVDSRLGG